MPRGKEGKMEDRKEEYFVKCMAVLEQISRGVGDLETLAWIAEDYLERLGEAIGIVRNEQL